MNKKSMSKYFVALFVIVLVICSVSFAKNFSDLNKTHWAYDTIILMQEEGYLNGYEDGTFKPEKEVSREEFMQMLYNVMHKPKASSKTMQNYYDVEEDRWSYNAVQVYGYYLKETSDGYAYLYPSRAIKRQEVAELLNGAFELDDEVELSTEQLKKQYVLKDASSIDKKYEEAVYNVYYKGLMKGMSDTEFSPDTSLTRAQAATLLARIIKIDEEPVTEQKDLDVEFLKLENKKENLIYSPLSIKYAIKMLSEGAEGNTKKQLDSLVAHYNPTKYNSSENLSLANSIFIRDSYKEGVLESYINTLKSQYDAEVVFDSFESAKPINSWIENKTFKLIKNILRDDQVNNPDSVLFLINALAIDMEWNYGFDENNTRGKDFVKENGSKIVATTMSDQEQYNGYDDFYSKAHFNYYLDDDIQVVCKDLKKYADTQLEFMAVMPKKVSLSDYTKDLTLEKINNTRSKVVDFEKTKYKKDVVTKINLRIPKFKFDYQLSFEDDLKSLGMTDAFIPGTANFKKMFVVAENKDDTHYVSDAIHKATIEFSEDGIKAAAVTIFGMKDSAAFIDQKFEYVNIDFDHPFFFVIRDKKTGEIWFVGTVYEPNLWEKDSSKYETKW